MKIKELKVLPSPPAPLTPLTNGLNLDFTKGEEERISSYSDDRRVMGKKQVSSLPNQKKKRKKKFIFLIFIFEEQLVKIKNC